MLKAFALSVIISASLSAHAITCSFSVTQHTSTLHRVFILGPQFTAAIRAKYLALSPADREAIDGLPWMGTERGPDVLDLKSMSAQEKSVAQNFLTAVYLPVCENSKLVQ